jgi:hypothetical protein
LYPLVVVAITGPGPDPLAPLVPLMFPDADAAEGGAEEAEANFDMPEALVSVDVRVDRLVRIAPTPTFSSASSMSSCLILSGTMRLFLLLVEAAKESTSSSSAVCAGVNFWTDL